MAGNRQAYIQEQHKFRGIISKYRSSAFQPNKNRSSLSCLRSDIKRQYLEARKNIHASTYADFIKWSKKQLIVIPELKNQQVNYDELWGVFTDAPAIPLDLEILWITERLRYEKEAINIYLNSKTKIERAVFSGRIEDAINEQDKQFREIGASLRGIQLRIAIENISGGIDAQKQYSTEIRGLYKTGLLKFVSFYSSMRNEHQSNLTSYIATVQSRINQHPYYSDSVKSYLEFHLLLDRKTDDRTLSDILRVEQSHSIVDLYETFISIVQIISCKDLNSKTSKIVAACIKKLSSIEDFRLRKIGHLHELELTNQCQPRNIQVLENLVGGNPIPVIKQFRKSLRSQDSIDSWQLIYTGLGFSFFGTKGNSGSHPREIPYFLGRIISMCPFTPDAIDILGKLLLNFRGIAAIDGVISFYLAITDSRHFDSISPIEISINSSFLGPEDEHYFSLEHLDTAFTSGWKRFYSDPAFWSTEQRTSPCIDYFEAASLFNKGLYFESLQRLDKFEHGIVKRNAFTQTLRIRLRVSTDDRCEIVKLVASECIQGGIPNRLIPIAYALSNFSKIDFQNFTDLSSLIALHLLWEETRTPENASNLRINIRRALKSYNVDLPSQLKENNQKIPLDQLIYFLNRVCSPEYIDQIRAINSTIELLEERQNICQILRQIDSDNRDIYEEEIAEIEYKKRLEEGEWIVDRTRIHVDSDALKRWCKDNISEHFNRYCSLATLSSTQDDDISDFLKDIISGQIADGLLDFPLKTEADQLLLEIVMEISEQFLKNPSFGLDFHLSKRIRHQSFIGLIRGPVETCGLITTKRSGGGEYHSNKVYLRSFDRLDQKDKDAIDRAFKVFSKNFDDRLSEAKDHYFQIYSPKQSAKGIIKLKLSVSHIRLIQELTKGTQNLSEFVDSVETVFWGTLEPSLKEARKYITEDLNHSLRKCFDELRGQVSARVDKDTDAYRNFTNHLSEGFKGVTEMLESACGWFTRLSQTHKFQAYRLQDMIDIAIKSSLKPYKTMDPIIELDISDKDTTMDAANTVIIHDVIFTAFGNIHKHSGLNRPKILVKASVDTDEEIFTISVENNLRVGTRRTSEPRLEEIKKKIEDRSYGNLTRKENKSGLIKLAASAHQSSKGKVEAGFIDDENFRMTVIYRAIIKPPIMDEDYEKENDSPC